MKKLIKQITKKRIVFCMASYVIATLEMGILLEIMWHGWGGFGGISKEYTETGSIGALVLIHFIPVVLSIVFVFYFIKNRKLFCKPRVREMLVSAGFLLLGIGIATGNLFLWVDGFVFRMGRFIASGFIEYWFGCQKGQFKVWFGKLHKMKCILFRVNVVKNF